MKKQYAIFFIFIVCSAVVVSSTMVVVLNFPYLLQTSQQLQAAAEQTTPAAPAAEVQQASTQINQPKTVAINSSSDSSSPTMDFTPAEKEQIAQMLNNLGIQAEDVSAETIKEFQSQNSLTPTGNLDNTTLNEIIRQLALVKAQAAVET